LRKPIYLKLTNEDIQRIRQQDERFLQQLYKDVFPIMMSVAVRFMNNRENN
jgi:hypothetical protein